VFIFIERHLWKDAEYHDLREIELGLDLQAGLCHFQDVWDCSGSPIHGGVTARCWLPCLEGDQAELGTLQADLGFPSIFGDGQGGPVHGGMTVYTDVCWMSGLKKIKPDVSGFK
jgi:hypothetical protein